MISNGENWHYSAVKSLSGLLRGITSNHNGDCYCLNCFHSYRTENKLNAHKCDWHYSAVKSLSGLLRGITSNHNGDCYCLNCFHSYRTENKLNAHKCENNEYCNIEMPSPNNNLIKYNQGEKSLKLPFVIYANLECILKKN